MVTSLEIEAIEMLTASELNDNVISVYEVPGGIVVDCGNMEYTIGAETVAFKSEGATSSTELLADCVRDFRKWADFLEKIGNKLKG
ncbi:hypothetical protein Pan241w_11490 [Gimesia alba]|uniref:Uncharacterized protein n=1 Tax=Gimesia alba TaxID=2527973 RepID=A0A517RB23_9PLAN|nr:hypothetical protein [Gimesia alba]QDT41090.1 hypothetical protein Pan241w_11490 [Gimesia alba]